MGQPSLFDPLPPYQPGSATSRAAAEQIVPHASAQEMHVLAALHQRADAGANQYEMHRMTGLRASSLCARCNALEGRGLIEKRPDAEGFPVTRPTDSNRQAAIYYLTAKGAAAWREG